MLFLGIISWKDVPCFNGEFVFQIGGASFLSGGCPMGASVFFGRFWKNCKMVEGGGCSPQYGKPWVMLEANKKNKKYKIWQLYLTNFYRTYLQNLKYSVKGACIFHLILVGILSILIDIVH